MAAPIGSLVASLELQSAAFNRGLDRATQAMRSQTAQMQRQTRALERSFQGVQRSVANLRTGIAALAGALAIRQFARFTQAAITAGDAIAKQADRLGVTTAALQEYRTLADLSGVGTERLDRAIGEFTRKLGEMRVGQGQLNTILERSNMSLRRQLLAARSTSEAFDIFITALGETENAFERNMLAGAAFARNAGIAMTTLARTIANTRPELREFIREFLQIPEHLTRQAEQLNDTMNLMRRAFSTGFHVGILSAFADAMNITIDDMKDIRGLAEELGRVVGTAMAAIARAARWAAENLRLIVAALSLFVTFRAATLFLDLAVAIGRATAAMVGLNVAAAANPMVLIAAGTAVAVAALILYHDKVIDVIGLQFTLGEVAGQVWQNIADGIQGTIRILGAFSAAMSAALTLDTEAMTAAVEEAWAGAEQLVRSRAGLLRMPFAEAKAPAVDLTDQIRTIAGEIMGAVSAAEGLGSAFGDARNPLADLARDTRNLQSQLAQFRAGGLGPLEAEQDVQAATAMVRQWAVANGETAESFAELEAAARSMLAAWATDAGLPLDTIRALRDEAASATDEIARIIRDRRTAETALADAQSRAREFANARQELAGLIDQQRLLIHTAGRETEEYRVQIRLLELKRRLGAGGAANLEAEVRAAERLTTALSQARELAEIRFETELVALPDIDQQFARILANLNLLRGFEGGVPIIDTANAAFALELMDALLIRQRELERAGLARGIEAGLRDVQIEVGLAGLPQAEREFAAFLRSLGILDVHAGELRTELQIDVRFAGQLGELEAAFDRLRAGDLAAEIESDLAGAMGRFGEELERVARSAEALPEAFSPEILQRGLERIGVAAIEAGAAFEDVAAALAMMGDEGIASIAVVDQRMKELQSQQLEVVSDTEQAWRNLGASIEDTAISATSRWLLEFRNARETFSNMLKQMANDLMQFGLRAALFGGVGAPGSRGGGGLFSVLFGFREGGMIPAMPGVPQGRDGVPIMAAPGEYIINATSAQRHAPLLEAINSDQLPRFQTGGMVGRMPALPSANGGGDLSIVQNISIDARGAGPDIAAVIEQAAEAGAARGVEMVLDLGTRTSILRDAAS